MVQHVNGILYTDKRIVNSVLWVVSAFVILGGYNTMSSWRRDGSIKVVKKISKIFIPYIVCTCIYVIWEYQFFNLEVVWQKVLHFNAAGPLYFVAVYMQLVVISPFLVGVIIWAEEKRKFFRHVIALSLVLCFSYVSVHYTNIFDIGLGAGNVFSGFWLIFWYGGMIFSVKKREIEQKGIYAGVLGCLCLLWEYFFVLKDYNNIFRNKYGNMYHMTAQLTWWNALEAFLVVLFLKETVELLEKKENKSIMICLKPICYIGQKSLYIFMYHILFRNIYYEYFQCRNIWIKRIVCFAFMMGGSILVFYILQALKMIIKEMIKRTKVQELE